MPTYEYYCETNEQTVEVVHSMKESLKTWGEVCERAKIDLQGIPPETPVKKLISACNFSVPRGNSSLKNMGFTKLVKRDKGVYENVTATDKEKRYFNANDPSSMPDFKKKIRD